MVSLLHGMSPDPPPHPSPPPGSSLTSCVFPPPASSLDDLSSLFPLRMPASYPFPDRLLASRGQETSSSVLLPSVSAAYSPLACPISISIGLSIHFSPVQETLSILLQFHISQASIFFSITRILILCPCLTSIKYHWEVHCIYNSWFCLQTYMHVCPSIFFKTLHYHFTQCYTPSYLLFAPALTFYQGS